jgi:hypothetical protein
MMERKAARKPGHKKKATGQLPLLESKNLTLNVKDPDNLRFIEENTEVVSVLLSQILGGGKITIRDEHMDNFITSWRQRLDKFPWRTRYGKKYFERTFYPTLFLAGINGWIESKEGLSSP